eukprot:scaffold4.g4810.t1
MAEGGKAHRKKKSGGKALKAAKRKKQQGVERGGGDEQARKQNPKAFVFASRGKAKIQMARSAERDQRRLHVPMADRAGEEPPPFTVLVQGPPGVGKTTLVKALIKHYTRQDVREIKGPVTLIAGKARRLTFVECPPDLSGMIDAAKYADLVLLLVDGGFGFEMETFEFLNLLQIHGFPKVMGVLTHLDGFRRAPAAAAARAPPPRRALCAPSPTGVDAKALKKTKKALKHRFWSEIYQGAKLFYLSGMRNGKYLKREVHNLARFIRFEDITPEEAVRENPKCDRDVALYGYVRGTNWKEGIRVHLAGVGDYSASDVAALPDPCPLPSQLKKRSLNERERLLYAPMSDVGGLLFDKDAVYIDIPDWKVQFSAAAPGGADGGGGEGEAMVRQLAATRLGVDEKLQRSRIQLFSSGQSLKGTEVVGGAAAGGYSDSEGEEGEEEASGSELEDNGEGGSSSEEEEEGGEGPGPPGGRPQEQVVLAADGRVRRRAVFGTDAVAARGDGSEGGESDSEAEGWASEEDEEGEGQRSAAGADWVAAGRRANDSEKGEEDGPGPGSDSDSDSEGLGAAARWKEGMLSRAAALFSTRGADLAAFIYGTRATADADAPQGQRQAGGSDDDDGEFFRPKRRAAEAAPGAGDVSAAPAGGGAPADLLAPDAPDCSRLPPGPEQLHKWEDPGAVEALRNRFVTGDWDAGAARAAARPGEEGEEGGEGGEEGEEEEAYGDFEDVETGERFLGSSDPATRAAAKAIQARPRRRLLPACLCCRALAPPLRERGSGATGVDDGGGGKKKRNKGGTAEEGEGEGDTYYDALKRDMAERAAKTRAMLDALDPGARVAMEGHRPGAYVRLVLPGLPCELVQHFDPRSPLLVGGVARGEEGQGYMQLRLKRHRWFPKLLKNRDPLVFSAGWRRFQSLPVFAIKDNNERLRRAGQRGAGCVCVMLKYSPEHMHCLAAVWGPLAPPSTGVLAVQKLAGQQRNWRVAATGVVLSLEAVPPIVKKLKLVGTPFKARRRRACGTVRTVSGIRGTVKKALRQGSQPGAREGAFRATFEDKPLLSDVVFLKAWVAVDVPRFCNPVTNLLAPREELARGAKQRKAQRGSAAAAAATDAAAAEGQEQEQQQQQQERQGAAAAAGGGGVFSVADLRRALGVGAPRDSDSLYRPIERGPRRFNPLKIPKSLQARVTLLSQLAAIRNQKASLRREQRQRQKERQAKKQAAEEAWRKAYNREERKKRYMEQGQAEKRAAKKART